MSDDGGPAFPVDQYVPLIGKAVYGTRGMSLRDWYAGQALANPALVARADSMTQSQLQRLFGDRVSGVTRECIIARLCSDLADAMLLARAQKSTEQP